MVASFYIPLNSVERMQFLKLLTNIWYLLFFFWTIHILTGRSPTSLIIKEMHIKRPWNCASLLSGCVLSKRKKVDTRYWCGVWETASFLHCWVECKMVPSSCRTALRFRKILQIELRCDQQSRCWYAFRKSEPRGDYCTAALVTIAPVSYTHLTLPTIYSV